MRILKLAIRKRHVLSTIANIYGLRPTNATTCNCILIRSKSFQQTHVMPEF